MVLNSLIFRILTDMADGVIKVTVSDWPSFLYCQEEHVKDDLESGLMKGYLLLRVRKALSSLFHSMD